MDNDQWLKNIGAVTVHDDDDRYDGGPVSSGITGGAPAGRADDGAGALDRGDADRVADRGLLLAGPASIPGERVPESLDLADAPPVDLDGPSADDAVRAPRRFTPWVVAAFGAAAVIGTVVTLVLTMVNSPDTHSVQASTIKVVPPRVVQAAPPSPPPNADGPLPFTAAADCPPGSTSAQSVADPNSTTPWICVRSVDGQVLQIDLGRTFVITAVSIVPGAVNSSDGGANTPDPWLQHRVVTRLQWQFNDTDRTVKNQSTGNVRGEAVESIRPGVLASKITVIIQETSRPPAVAPTNVAPTPGPGGGTSILGGILGGSDKAQSSAPGPLVEGTDSTPDPADGTFAVSGIKIIGHKAV